MDMHNSVPNMTSTYASSDRLPAAGTCSSSGRASDDSDQDSKQGESSSRQATEPPEFFDPEADDKSEAWVSKLRGGRRSDAILSCPQCFTTLCLECQQHAHQHNQFRAMFVMNCRCSQPLWSLAMPLSRADEIAGAACTPDHV